MSSTGATVVPLFIDRLRFYSWLSPEIIEAAPQAVPLSIIPSRPGLDGPPPGVAPQCWWLDTGFTAETLAWRHHLEEAGMDPDEEPAGTCHLSPPTGFGPGTEFPQCAGDLWLISNIPALQARPYRIVLGDGIAYRNIRRLPEPEKNCPLIGMRALEESGLRILIDYPNKSVSVWTPGPWYESLWIWLRRMASGFRTRSMSWSQRN